MNRTPRQQQILELLQEHRYLSVAKLSELTYTSPSSVRRDLAKLQTAHDIQRTHGGASLLQEGNRSVHLNDRLAKNVAGKRKIAKKAASLLCDGMTVMLDGSTTAGFLVPHLARKNNILLFTNNMLTAMHAIERGINTHCIGGSSVNHSAVLSGPQSYRTVLGISPDLLFFSSQSLDKNGVISDPTEEENHLRLLMLEQANQRVFLCDSEKFGQKSFYTLTTLDEIDLAVFDTEWDELQTTCKIL